MSPDQKPKIFLMAGALAVAIAVFVVFFMSNKNKPNSTNGTAPPSNGPNVTAPGPGATAPGPGATVPAPTSGVPGAPPSGAATQASMTPGAGAVETPKSKIPPPPGAPPMIGPSAASGSLPDPFSPQPKPQWMKDRDAARYQKYLESIRPKPMYVRIATVPPINPGGGFYIVKGPVDTGAKDVAEMSSGRLAGWIYNHNGQITAIFEDTDGTTRAVKVGDDIGGRVVKVIAQDYIILVGQGGNEETVKLQGLQANKKAQTDVQPQPATGMPAMPGF